MGCCLSHHLFLLVWARCLSQQNSSLPSFFSLQTAKTDTSGGVTGLSRGGAKHSFCTECFPDGLLGSSVGSPLHVPRGTWVLLLAEGRGQALLLRLLCPSWADSPPAGLSGRCSLWTSHLLMGRPPRRSSLGMATLNLRWHDLSEDPGSHYLFFMSSSFKR